MAGQERQAVGDHYRERCHDYQERRRREHRERFLDEPPRDAATEGAYLLLPPRQREHDERQESQCSDPAPPPVELGAAPTNISPTCTNNVVSRIWA